MESLERLAGKAFAADPDTLRREMAGWNDGVLGLLIVDLEQGAADEDLPEPVREVHRAMVAEQMAREAAR